MSLQNSAQATNATPAAQTAQTAAAAPQALIQRESKPAPATTSGSNRQLPEPQGWLNLQLIDAANKQHRLPAGLAMLDDQRVYKAMMDKLRSLREQAAAAGKPESEWPVSVEFNLIGTVTLATKPQDIVL